MKLSRTYMKGTEFKNRQIWLPFIDSVGIALEVMSESLFEARQWLKKFIGTKPKKVCINRTKWLWLELTGIQQNFKFRVN